MCWALGLAGVAATLSVVIAASATPPATQPATRSSRLGPDVVVLKELVSLYEPVPFDHKSHAKMAEMWEGCTTCHHRNPEPATRPAQPDANGHARQEDSATYPACKHCHPIEVPQVEMRLPSLKGAYHRQCLNCHRDWSGANDCVICHRPRDAARTRPAAPTRDDIIGRMHPPIPAPQARLYKVRFTPADGPNVLFRHDEHVKSYGLKCAHCHRHDNCSHCHDSGKTHKPPEPHVLKPAETWKESHGPCVGCHAQTSCRGCHYKDNQSAPPPFLHASTGQRLDKDHEKLTCNQCHPELRSKAQLTCGGSACHKRGEVIAYPAYRPGPFAATQPATRPATMTMEPTRGVVR